MENFKNSLDKSIFDEMPKNMAFEYIKAKYGEGVKKEVEKALNNNKMKNERKSIGRIK